MASGTLVSEGEALVELATGQVSGALDGITVQIHHLSEISRGIADSVEQQQCRCLRNLLEHRTGGFRDARNYPQHSSRE